MPGSPLAVINVCCCAQVPVMHVDVCCFNFLTNCCWRHTLHGIVRRCIWNAAFSLVDVISLCVPSTVCPEKKRPKCSRNIFYKTRETPEFILPHRWPQNLPNLNPDDYSVWGLLQQNVYKMCITELNELKQRLRTEWAKLDHVVIAVAICQWRRW